MKNRNIMYQSIICLCFACGFMLLSSSERPAAVSAAAFISKHLENVKETVKSIPSSMAKAAETLGPNVRYGEPIDEEPSSATAMVYAVAGGTVREVGTNEDIGNYIIISHGSSAESIYGNLANIRVSANERVKKGEIIGGYSTDSKKDFYYTLNSFD